MTVADILARRRPLEKRVRLLLDGSLAAQMDETRREIRQAKARESLSGGGLASTLPELERQLAELALAADDSSAAFTFRAIPRARLEDLKRRHPPSAEQWEKFREEQKGNIFAQAPQFDWVGLAPDLIAASCSEPAMTVEEARRLWDELSDGEAAQLFEAAWSVNEQATARPFSGTGTDTTPTSGPSSTTPQREESPSLSLADGS